MPHDPGDEKKWEYLRTVPAVDASKPQMQELAAALDLVARRSPWRDWAYAQLALAVARDCILYELDTDRVGREQIDGFTDPYVRPDLPLVRGIEDCDGKARMFVALCLAGRVRAEMVPGWRGDRLGHVYARAWLAGPKQSPRWWFAETILRRARLGEESPSVPKEVETGKWLM
jgi:transglutaminase-like putative cysteine protease